MDFELSYEQRELAASVGRLLADRYAFADRKRYAAAPEGWSRELWSHYAELGLLGLPFPSEHGGFGGGAVDVMLTMEAFGRVLALEPYLATVVLAGSALRLAGSAAQQGELIPRIAAGELLLAWAHDEGQGGGAVATRARRNGQTWSLDGAKTLVLHGASAQTLVVSARTSDDEGLGLFLVEAGAPGVALQAYRLVDGSVAANLSLAGVPGTPLGEVGGAAAVIARVIEAGIAALAAEAVGAMQAALDLSVDYLKTREQFGRPIGQNQALQHRAAEMLIATEQARSMAMLAAMMVDEVDASERQRNIAMAKVLIGRESRRVGQQAVQLHGGIGMTEEYAVGHYFRRLAVIEQLFGDGAYHLRRLAELRA